MPLEKHSKPRPEAMHIYCIDHAKSHTHSWFVTVQRRGKEAEREQILRVLHETKWVVGGPSGAAARLGLKRTTLQSKMQKLSITRPAGLRSSQ